MAPHSHHKFWWCGQCFMMGPPYMQAIFMEIDVIVLRGMVLNAPFIFFEKNPFHLFHF